jgi:hypothetical protein
MLREEDALRERCFDRMMLERKVLEKTKLRIQL